MIWTVSFAASSLISAHNTFAPSRANKTAVGFPLPQPGPTDPAPTTRAILSCKRPTIILLQILPPVYVGGRPRGPDPFLAPFAKTSDPASMSVAEKRL